MAKVKLALRWLIEGSQEISDRGAGDHLISKVLFDVEVNGHAMLDCGAEIRQPYGTQWLDPVEVGGAQFSDPSFRGPWSHSAFAEQCDLYFHEMIGPSGTNIEINGPVGLMQLGSGLRLQHMRVAVYDVPDAESAGGW